MNESEFKQKMAVIYRHLELNRRELVEAAREMDNAAKGEDLSSAIDRYEAALAEGSSLREECEKIAAKREKFLDELAGILR